LFTFTKARLETLFSPVMQIKLVFKQVINSAIE